MFTRTKIFSVYVKKDSKNPLDTAVFVKQGFSFWAFFFAPIWALYNRLWFAFLLLVVFSVLLAINKGPEFTIASLILNIWFGFEANNFKTRKLERRGYIVFDVVTGIDKLAAQTRFYDKYLLNKPVVKQSSFGFSN
jgi:hypothetical protein